jgi:hypothetical protein
MNNYGIIADKAAQMSKKGASPESAWDQAALEIFPSQESSRKKSCPRSSFLGIASEGFLNGVPKGDYTTSKKNMDYAIRALKIVAENPSRVWNPQTLWKELATNKQHNSQMDVVLSLWENQFIQYR